MPGPGTYSSGRYNVLKQARSLTKLPSAIARKRKANTQERISRQRLAAKGLSSGRGRFRKGAKTANVLR